MGGLYDARWQRRRAAHLRAHPLCAFCLARGETVRATVADHVTPHRGDRALFHGELQSLCKTCHDSTKQRIEKSGSFGCDANGLPLGDHWWNEKR